MHQGIAEKDCLDFEDDLVRSQRKRKKDKGTDRV